MIPRRPILIAALCSIVGTIVPTASRCADGVQPLPNVVFLLLDTTSADRMSGWGNARETTPNIDALARSGVRFARHFANSHATRPSMPQLMSGRYYQSTILREFRPRTHPRDWPFATLDPTIALLPEILHDAGYRLLAVSAHPWITRRSRLGAPFDVFEEPAVAARRGHADASVMVDRAVSLWSERPHDRPTFLYVHFMDTHIPRYVAPGQLKFGRDDPIARARFDAAGEPAMEDPWHEWDRSDARAFTRSDVEFFTAVYDTILARLDAEVGRLVAAIRADDPNLARTMIVVTADHGEELGAHGRISHEDSLDDAVQHVPLLLTGGNVLPGQVAWGVTEHVDVVPTVVESLGLSPPKAARFDGHSLLANGRVCTACLRSAAVFAWETYRGLRMGRKVLREEVRGSFAAACAGRRQLLDDTRRSSDAHAEAINPVGRLLGRLLDGVETRFRSTRYSQATTSFSVLPSFWQMSDDANVACVDAGPDTPREAFGARGWVWTGRGLLLVSDPRNVPPIGIIMHVPDGDYVVGLGVRNVPPLPRFFGYARWLRKGLRPTKPEEQIPLGERTAIGGTLRVDVPSSIASGRHILAVHLRPAGHVDRGDDLPEGDPTIRERLRSLGYVD